MHPELMNIIVFNDVSMTSITLRLAFAYISGVTCEGIKYWSTGINQESIKLLSNLKWSDFTSSIVLLPFGHGVVIPY